MKRVYYFAYGRNMLRAAIEWRVGVVKKIGPYRLEGYKLAFNTGWYSAFANLVKGKGKDFVEGVLYELTDEQIANLDRCEGYPSHYQKRYFLDPEQDIVYAYISTRPEMYSDRLAAREYIVDLYHGAKENGLEYTQQMMKDYLDNVLQKPLKKRKSSEPNIL